jgi:hypothetical protein
LNNVAQLSNIGSQYKQVLGESGSHMHHETAPFVNHSLQDLGVKRERYKKKTTFVREPSGLVYKAGVKNEQKIKG